MERLAEISEYWNWLPAFRAVAETQHLPTAAKGLGIGAPALSRSIRLLEDKLGTKLFRREGRGLILNEEGQRFLQSLRMSMRHVHEGMLSLREEQFEGSVHIASSGVITTSYLLPALCKLKQMHPRLIPNLSGSPPRDVVAQLLSGRLDVAFTSDPIDGNGLERVQLGYEGSGVYCGPGHPLYEHENASTELICSFDFVGPPTKSGRGSEGWPAELPRKLAAVVDQMRIGAEFCASGRYLAVLPDALARSYGAGGVLRRLPVDITTRAPLFALHRSTIGRAGRAEAVVEAVRSLIEI